MFASEVKQSQEGVKDQIFHFKQLGTIGVVISNIEIKNIPTHSDVLTPIPRQPNVYCYLRVWSKRNTERKSGELANVGKTKFFFFAKNVLFREKFWIDCSLDRDVKRGQLEIAIYHKSFKLKPIFKDPFLGYVNVDLVDLLKKKKQRMKKKVTRVMFKGHYPNISFDVKVVNFDEIYKPKEKRKKRVLEKKKKLKKKKMVDDLVFHLQSRHRAFGGDDDAKHPLNKMPDSRTNQKVVPEVPNFEDVFPEENDPDPKKIEVPSQEDLEKERKDAIKELTKMYGENFEKELKNEKEEVSNEKLQELQEKYEQMMDANSCVVCLDSRKTIAFDCMHLCVCEKCADSLKTCPLCRKAITKRMKIYF